MGTGRVSGPKFVTGDLWDEIGRADVVAVTANCCLRSNGRPILVAELPPEVVVYRRG